MLTCYPQPNKGKSGEILSAFLEGWGGGCGSAFYGLIGIEHVFQDARRRGTYFVGDNAFFDRLRGSHFRFARDAFQPTEAQPPDWARFAAQGVKIRDWRRGGHVVVVEQSEHFLTLSGAGADWRERTVEELRRHTDRPLVIRRWRRDKDKAARGLQEDLKGAHALVTHASAAAIEALLAGVPVFVTGQSAAVPMASGPLASIESPHYPEEREPWAAGLANSHWTLAELRGGIAWRRLAGSTEPGA